MEKIKGKIKESKFVLYKDTGYGLRIGVDYEDVGEVSHLFRDRKKIIKMLEDKEYKSIMYIEPKKLIGKTVLSHHFLNGMVKIRNINF